MDLVLRAAFVFGFMVLLTRVIGKRELGSLQPFDLILLIILGDALQQGMTQDDYSLTGAVLVVGRSPCSRSACRGSRTASLGRGRCSRASR